MSEKKETFSSVFEILRRRPRLLIIVLLAYIGTGLIYVGMTGIELSPLIERYGLISAGSLTLFMAFIILLEMRRNRPIEFGDRVSSVDVRRRHQSESESIRGLRAEIKNFKETQNIDYEKIENMIFDSDKKMTQLRLDQYKSFSSYFDGLRTLLENKSTDADEKASILLDKGTAYSRFGIFFFILSIFVWQFAAYLTQFQEQYIYGIASCSLLFVFIEFLSAWFLRQYRNYVDTSTYLIKIKSIFDRYMLSYLAIHDSEKDTSSLAEILADDIKWPETYLMKNADIGFAKEAMEAMSYLAQSVKKEAKNKKSDGA